MVTGEIIALESHIIWLILPLTLAYLLIFTGPWEERQLTMQHGEHYLAYKRRIRNWIPTFEYYEE
jgi:protein-S-isoprenylcysteine O-methyltransferase Ste14